MVFPNIRFKLAGLCIFMLPVIANAQSSWSLQQCVDYALQHNLSVKQQYLSTQSSKIAVDENKFNLAPTLSGSASGNYNWGRSVDPFSYTFTNSEIKLVNMSLNANVALFNGFQLQNTLKQSQLNYLAGQSDLRKIQNDIALNVVSSYLQLLYAKEQQKVMVNGVDESTQQRDRTQKLVDAGVMTRGNLLDAESQLANQELNKITADNQVAIARLSLVQLLELDSTPSFDIASPNVDVPQVGILTQTPEQIYTTALTHLPEIKSADLKVLSANLGIRIAQGGYIPRLSMFGSLSSGYSSTSKSLDGSPVYLGMTPTGYVTQSGEQVLSPSFSTNYKNTSFGDQIDNNLTKSLGLSLSIPIFNGFSARYNVSRARISGMNAEISSQQTKNGVYKSIQQAHTDAFASQKKYFALEKSVAALQEAFDYAEKRYNAGLTSSLEYLTATNNLTKGKIEFLQAKYDYIFRVKVLDFYAGNPLTF